MQQNNISSGQNIRPPQIKGWPLVGVLPYLYRQKLDFLLQARAEHGDVFRVRLGTTDITVLGHPDHAQHVLIDNARNYQNKGSVGWRIAPLPLMRSGLATTIQAQAAWQQQRRGVQPYFHPKRLGDLTNWMAEAIAECLIGWDDFVTSGQAIDTMQEVTRIIINVIGKTIFGIRIPAEEADSIATEFRIVMDYLWRGTIQNSLPDWIPVPGKARYQQAIRAFDAHVDQLTERALQPHARPDNLIVTLNKLVKTGDMTREQLHNEAVTLLVAGYESSSANLSWVFHLLTQHQTIQHRLQSEITTVLGTRLPAFADIADLSYSRMVLQETLRLYAPSYWIQRQAAADDEIGGFHIPAGEIVVSMIHLVHMHPDIWEQPDRFDPERFLPEHVQARHKRAWLPFGAGKRMCMAVEFALIQGQLILSQIFQRYHLSAVPGGTAPEAFVASNIRPKQGVRVHASLRTKSH